jgi:hypothetical protein
MNTIIINDYTNTIYIDLKEYKLGLINHIDDKLNVLRDKLQIISLRYDSTKKMFNYYSLSMLLLSAILTLVEAFKLLLTIYLSNNNINSEFMEFILSLFSLCMGTLLTILTSIIRFKNYRENMEKLKELQDKIINLRSLYSYQQSILELMNGENEKILEKIEKTLEEYIKDLNEINIVNYISNKKMLKFKQYISSFKVDLLKLHNQEVQIKNNISNQIINNNI